MKIGILSCGHAMPEVAERHGDYPQMFETLLAGKGLGFEAFDVENMQFPGNIHACDGWLLTGSKHGAYEDHAFIPPLETFIQQAYAHHVPLVGICFGHQIIAQALGGHVEKFQGGWAVGLTEYEFDDIGTVHLNAWHQDQVVQCPENARPVASNSFCENAALVYDTRAYTVQPHPEFDGGVIAQFVSLRRGTADYPDALMDRAAKMSEQQAHNAKLADQIAAFFKQPREVARAS